jgi:hypothetical protein
MIGGFGRGGAGVELFERVGPTKTTKASWGSFPTLKRPLLEQAVAMAMAFGHVPQRRHHKHVQLNPTDLPNARSAKRSVCQTLLMTDKTTHKSEGGTSVIT